MVGCHLTETGLRDAADGYFEQFVDAESFAVSTDRGASDVHGRGSVYGSGVRFHEKDTLSGKDVRVWQISEVDGAFEATATAAF